MRDLNLPSPNQQPEMSAAIDQIAAAARLLLLPSTALYELCNQARLRAKDEKIAVLQDALNKTAAEGIAAAVALRSLGAAPPTSPQSYTGIIAKGCNE